MLDQSGANWIAEHIAEGREYMSVLLNRNALKSALPDMSMARHPPLHIWTRDTLDGWRHNQMEMSEPQAHAEYFDGDF